MRPLDGVRVVDLSRLLPGPYATMCLQGLGATVVKVEQPGAGDYLRHIPPLATRDGHEVGVWFAALNRGKRSVALDLKVPADRDALLALLVDADVLVESYRPGVLARLGLDPAALRERFPRLVITSLTGFGQTGPYRDLPGHDVGYLALAGLLHGPSPTLPLLQWADVAAGGLAAALRIVAALHARERTGEGGWLDVAMLDGLVSLNPMTWGSLAAGFEPSDLLLGGLPTYDVYRCADGWIAVGALEPQFAARLAAEVGSTERADLAATFLTRTRAEWGEKLADACVVPVLAPREVPADPHVRARSLFDPEGFVSPPTGPVSGPVPALGEHTAAELARVGVVRP